MVQAELASLGFVLDQVEVEFGDMPLVGGLRPRRSECEDARGGSGGIGLQLTVRTPIEVRIAASNPRSDLPRIVFRFRLSSPLRPKRILVAFPWVDPFETCLFRYEFVPWTSLHHASGTQPTVKRPERMTASGETRSLATFVIQFTIVRFPSSRPWIAR